MITTKLHVILALKPTRQFLPNSAGLQMSDPIYDTNLIIATNVEPNHIYSGDRYHQVK